MPRRLVSVGDDFTLPAAVKAADANLPARLSDASLSATILSQTQEAISNPETSVSGAVQELIDGSLASFTPAADLAVVVRHGSIASTARPAHSGTVVWVGTVAPANRIAGDLYYMVTEEPAPWSPLSEANLLAWYDPTNVTTSDGTAVTAWPDKSPYARHANVVEGSVTKGATAFNGTPGVIFNGSSRLKTGSFASIGGGALTVFSSVRHTATGAIATFYDGQADARLQLNRQSTTTASAWRGGSGITATTSFGAAHHYCAVYDGASSQIYIDGTLAVTGTTSSAGTGADITALTLGGRPVSTSNYMTGQMGDFFVLSGHVSDATRAQAFAWLAARSGITVA